MSMSTPPQRSGPEAQQLNRKLGTSIPGTGSSSMPTFPENRWGLLNQLDADPRAADLVERLRPILAQTADMDAKGRILPGTEDDDKRAEACFREMRQTWDAYLAEREFLGDSWPPHFDDLKRSLQDWEDRYAIREAQEMLRPAARPEDDWRLQVCRWCLQPENSRGPRPEILRWEIPCHTIPKWGEGRTWLTLIPAPFGTPPYLPAVVDLPPGTDLLLETQLRLKQGSMEMETRLMSIGFQPPEDTRIWLLRLAHLSQACWIVT